jgi:dTDP-4-dehydrorhamnose reductase
MGREYTVIQHGSQMGFDITCDLTDLAQTANMLKEVKPDVVVNLVGATNVDECERHPQSAYLLNTRTVENLVAGLTGIDGAFLVQVSTDQIYNAFGNSDENDVCLTNTYAMSKYAGELAALRMPTAVLRTNFFGPSRHPTRKSFSDWLLDKFRDGKGFTAFSDVAFTPLSMDTLSAAIDRVLRHQVAGVFNLGSRQGMSKADFAAALAHTFDLPTEAMRRGSTTDVELAAYRPKDMCMNSSKFEQTFDMKLPRLSDEIKRLRSDINVVT